MELGKPRFTWRNKSMFDAAKLRRLRDEHKLTTKQLADQCGISRGYISQIESGTRQPSLEIVSRLSEALGISPLAVPNQDQPTTNQLRSDVIDGREIGKQHIQEISELESETTNDVLPLSALLGFSRGCAEDQNMSLLFGEDKRTEVRLCGLTQQWGRNGLHKFTCIAGRSVVQLHLERQNSECCDGLYAFPESDELNRPDVELELHENGYIKQHTLVWFTSYASLADRLQFLRQHAGRFQLKVWEPSLSRAWCHSKALTELTSKH